MALKVKANNASRARNRLIGIFIAAALIVFICIMTAISSAEMKKVVTVVRIKEDSSLSANAMITDDMVEAYDMYYKEFQQYGTMKFSDGTTRSTIVRWSDKDNVIGKRYSAYYQRGGTMLFWDSTISDQTRKNSYLYSMSGELLNINMTTTSEFGDMVVPGDTLNIRATYTAKVYTLPSEEEYKLSSDAGTSTKATDGVEVTKTDLLFSEVTILDMLNGSGNSIFDIYYDYISMSKEQQAAALEDDAFLDSVKPSSILLECTAEEVERYMYLQDLGASYQMTLLPRTSSSQITDSLSEIQEALAGIAGLSE
jgi:hypothetical protein